MALPISEQIAAAVKTRLLLIDEDDGYQTTVAGVDRPTRISTQRPRDYQIRLGQGDLQPNPAYSRPGNPPAQGWTLPFHIFGELRPSDTDTTPIDTLKNVFAADVQKALTSVADWHNWGQLAIDSQLGPVANWTDPETSGQGFRMMLAVMFRTDEDDPYTARA